MKATGMRPLDEPQFANLEDFFDGYRHPVRALVAVRRNIVITPALGDDETVERKKLGAISSFGVERAGDLIANVVSDHDVPVYCAMLQPIQKRIQW